MRKGSRSRGAVLPEKWPSFLQAGARLLPWGLHPHSICQVCVFLVGCLTTSVDDFICRDLAGVI